MSPRTIAVSGLALLLVGGVAWALLSGGPADQLRPLTFGESDLESYIEEGEEGLEADLDGIDGRRSVDPLDGLPLDSGARPELLIRGRVVDRFGAPVRAATVRLEFRRGFQRGGQRNRVRKPVTTGADGRFAFQGRGYENLALTLQVRAEGHAPLLSDHEFESASGSLDVGDLALLDGGGLRGRVTDLEDGGIPGAEVTLRPIAGNRLAWSRDRGELLPPAQTDATGAYAFADLMPGTYRVEASAPRRQRGLLREPIVVEDGRVEEVAPIRLGVGYDLSGTVFGPGGAPVAGANVRVRSEDRTPRFDERSRSDSDGRFVFAHIPEALLSVSVQAEGLLGWEGAGIDPKLGQPLVVRLEEGLRISGTVVDARSSAPVELFAAKVRRLGSLKSSEQRIELEMLRGHLERLREQASAEPENADQAQQAMRNIEERMVRIERGGGTGGPALNAWTSPGTRERPLRVAGDLGPPVDRPGGTFAFEGLDEGVYAVDVLSPDHQFTRSATISLSRETGSHSGLQVALERGLRVAGTVVAKGGGARLSEVRVELSRVREDGPPVPRRLGEMTWPPSGPGPRGDTVMSVQTDGNGHFAFSNAPAGQYFVTARHRDRETARTEPFQLAADRDDLRIELGATATLHGQVQGIPPGREDDLSVLAFGGFGRMRTARVGPGGRYELEGLQPGGYSVRAFAGQPRVYMGVRMPRFLDAENLTIDVTLSEGERRAFDPVVDVPPVGAVAGTVTLNGRPASGYRVEVRARDGSDMVRGVRYRAGNTQTAVLDQRGRFELTDLPVATYTVTVTNRSRQAVYRQPVAVSADATTRVDAHLSTGGLRGRVTTSDDTPDDLLDGNVSVLPGAATAPGDLREYGRENLVVDVRIRDGRFDGSDIPAGPALAVVSVRGRLRAATPIVIPAGSATEVELPAGDRPR